MTNRTKLVFDLDLENQLTVDIWKGFNMLGMCLIQLYFLDKILAETHFKKYIELNKELISRLFIDNDDNIYISEKEKFHDKLTKYLEEVYELIKEKCP